MSPQPDAAEEIRKLLSKHLHDRPPTNLYRGGFYRKVTTLALTWKEDTMGCVKEARALNQLFSDRFGFTTNEFAIPSEKPYWATSDMLHKLFRDHGDLGSLIIIYYGGHGDSDKDYERYGAVFAAHQSGGPTLRWDLLQKLLESGENEADVLLILDCCYAAQAARNRDKTTHRFQLLAAAARGCKTPGVGKSSFTTRLIEQIKLLLDAQGVVGITQLHRQLTKRDANCTETPILIDMLPIGESTTIKLCPLVPVLSVPSSSLMPERNPPGPVTLKFIIPQGLNAASSSNVTSWLRIAPAEIGDTVWIEAVPSPVEQTSLRHTSSFFVGISGLHKNTMASALPRMGGSLAPGTEMKRSTSGMLVELSRIAAAYACNVVIDDPKLRTGDPPEPDESEYVIVSDFQSG